VGGSGPTKPPSHSLSSIAANIKHAGLLENPIEPHNTLNLNDLSCRTNKWVIRTNLHLIKQNTKLPPENPTKSIKSDSLKKDAKNLPLTKYPSQTSLNGTSLGALDFLGSVNGNIKTGRQLF
jgi:hypothetical protein